MHPRRQLRVGDDASFALATRRRVRFMLKAELWRYPLVRWGMEAYGAVDHSTKDTGAMAPPATCSPTGRFSACFRAARRSRQATALVPRCGAASRSHDRRAARAGAPDEHEASCATSRGRSAHRRAGGRRAVPTDDRRGSRVDHARRRRSPSCECAERSAVTRVQSVRVGPVAQSHRSRRSSDDSGSASDSGLHRARRVPGTRHRHRDPALSCTAGRGPA